MRFFFTSCSKSQCFQYLSKMRKIQESIRSLATTLKLRKQKKGFEKQVPIRSNHFPVYVGDQEHDEKLNRYDVPVACTSSIIFQALLRQFEDILRVEEGPITISCSKQMFESVLKLSLEESSISEVRDSWRSWQISTASIVGRSFDLFISLEICFFFLLARFTWFVSNTAHIWSYKTWI